jgi:shikimate dehydrogenase
MAGLDGTYDLYPVETAKKYQLAAEINRLRTGEISGFNVTIPYKEDVHQYLDQLTPTAKAIGAVNTIFTRHGMIIGDNTDAHGFVLALKDNGMDLSFLPGEAIVFGAGGSARAVIYSLLAAGWQIELLVRNVEKSRERLRNLDRNGLTGGLKIRPVEELPSVIKKKQIDLVVNTTPLGMFPNVDGSPWKDTVSIPASTFVFDLIYNPVKTLLLSQAELAGAKFTNGFSMLLEQAVLSFEIWTNQKIDSGELLRQYNQIFFQNTTKENQ